MINLAINGFGRIGRVALRVILARYLDKVKPVAVNTSGSMDLGGWAQLFEFDSVYGQFKGKIELKPAEEKSGEELGVMMINQQKIPFLAQREPVKIPWKKYGVEVVLESTGVFRERKLAAAHLEAGAQKVIISAPTEGAETLVIGANQQTYRGSLIVNNASCTTNCAAPLVKIMIDGFGVEKAWLTTIHAYTADQELVDGSHSDLRRARAAAVNIIPTSTGADEATIEVLPDLKGLFNGLSLRVPVVCGSVCDLTFITSKRTTAKEVNQVFIKASQTSHKGIVAVSEKPLVSTDIVGNSASAIVDLPLTQVVDGDLVKLVAWYDNEWAYACRLVEMAILVGEKNG